MQIITTSKLFMTALSSRKPSSELMTRISFPGYYQLLASLALIQPARTEEALIETGNRLVALASHANTFRQMDAVEQIGQSLMSLPLPPQFESIGRYYHGLYLMRRGGIAEAGALFEKTAEESTPTYRARALTLIGASFFLKGDLRSSLQSYIEAARIASRQDIGGWRAIVEAHRSIAMLKSVNGDHHGAVADLESLYPLVRVVSSSHPVVYYYYLNSLAVEFCEVGRLEEARRASEIAIASPYASAYPEWHDTRNKIARRQYRTPRSFIALARATIPGENVLSMPVTESTNCPTSSSVGDAKILNYTEWKNKMMEKPNGNSEDDQRSNELTDRHLLLKIVELASTDDLSGEALHEMVEALEKIVAAYKGKN